MNQTVAVVVTCNRKAILKQCVEKLFLQTVSCDVLVVDNASSDGTAEYLETLKRENRVHVIKLSRNLGGAGGFNLGIRKAVEYGYEYIWTMDDDTLPRPDTFCG